MFGNAPGGQLPVILEGFSALQSLLLSTQTLREFLGEVARLAPAVVEPPASCGITTRHDGQPLTVASSDSVAERVDEAQYDAGEGPCLESLRSGAVIDVPDLRAEQRWPLFRAEAVRQGVGSSLSLPLSVDGTTIGALNLYGYKPAAFAGATHQHAEVFARQAATAITLMLRQAKLAQTSAQLEQALTSRSVIDHAIGVLMAEQHCTAEDAFALLRTHSMNHNIKLRQVAADILARVSGKASAAAPPRPAGRPTGADNGNPRDGQTQLDH